jgi:hypothetical protein
MFIISPECRTKSKQKLYLINALKSVGNSKYFGRMVTYQD